MEDKNVIKVQAKSNGAELNISAPSIKQTISATNNRAQYFAEQAKKYCDEAKTHRDNAKYYLEQNSDVTFDYIDNVKSELEFHLSKKQNVGNYALKEDLPLKLSDLRNDIGYVNQTELFNAIEAEALPSQVGCEGKVLMSDGENESWVGINSFQLFDTKMSDKILSYEESKGWALQGTYVYKSALAGSRYGYPDFYNKVIEEFNQATTTETLNGVALRVNANGHKFYNIADKASIDSFFNTTGSAWFYGVDIVNERIFLPRDKYFALKGDVPIVGNGIALGLTDGTSKASIYIRNMANLGGSAAMQLSKAGYGTTAGTVVAEDSSWGTNARTTIGVTTDSTKSGIEGKLIANEDKYLYICVGNTTNYEGATEVVNQGMDILEQVNQGIESRVKVDGSNAEFPYILDTYVNGTSGYRTWSDKYHEEWGFLASTLNASTTINYVKPFANTNYNLVVSMSASGTPNVNVGWQTKTTTSFVAYTYQQKNNPEGTHWRACGYIA